MRWSNAGSMFAKHPRQWIDIGSKSVWLVSFIAFYNSQQHPKSVLLNYKKIVGILKSGRNIII